MYNSDSTPLVCARCGVPLVPADEADRMTQRSLPPLPGETAWRKPSAPSHINIARCEAGLIHRTCPTSQDVADQAAADLAADDQDRTSERNRLVV